MSSSSSRSLRKTSAVVSEELELNFLIKTHCCSLAMELGGNLPSVVNSKNCCIMDVAQWFLRRLLIILKEFVWQITYSSNPLRWFQFLATNASKLVGPILWQIKPANRTDWSSKLWVKLSAIKTRQRACNFYLLAGRDILNTKLQEHSYYRFLDVIWWFPRKIVVVLLHDCIWWQHVGIYEQRPTG